MIALKFMFSHSQYYGLPLAFSIIIHLLVILEFGYSCSSHHSFFELFHYLFLLSYDCIAFQGVLC